MRQDLKKPCPFFIFLFISEDDIMSSRSIRNHCDRISDFFFDKLNVVSAVLRKIFVFLDSSDVAFPSRKCLEYWFCFLKKMCCREFCCNFSVNLVSYTYRNFIQVSKYINNSKCYICSSLHTASIFGCYTVKPSHTSRATGCCAEFPAVSTASSEFICFFAKNLTYKGTCSYCT